MQQKLMALNGKKERIKGYEGDLRAFAEKCESHLTLFLDVLIKRSLIPGRPHTLTDCLKRH